MNGEHILIDPHWTLLKSDALISMDEAMLVEFGFDPFKLGVDL